MRSFSIERLMSTLNIDRDAAITVRQLMRLKLQPTKYPEQYPATALWIAQCYHRPSDTAEKLDYDKLARVTRLSVRLLEGLQTDTLEYGR